MAIGSQLSLYGKRGKKRAKKWAYPPGLTPQKGQKRAQKVGRSPSLGTKKWQKWRFFAKKGPKSANFHGFGRFSGVFSSPKTRNSLEKWKKGQKWPKMGKNGGFSVSGTEIRFPEGFWAQNGQKRAKKVPKSARATTTADNSLDGWEIVHENLCNPNSLTETRRQKRRIPITVGNR